MPLPLHLLSTIMVDLLHERAALVRLLVFGFESTVAEVAVVFYRFLKLALSGGDERHTNP